MKQFIIILIFSFSILIDNYVYSQDQTQIDSLKQVIATEKVDTTIIKSYLKLGDVYEYTIPDTALFYYQKALKIAEKNKEKNFIAKSYNNIGIIYAYQGNYEKTLEYWEKALKINEELGNKYGIASNLGNIGIVYMDQSNYPKALEYYQKAIKIFEEIGDKDGIASNLISIGIVYKNQSNYDKALNYYLQALKIYKALGNRINITEIQGNIGILYYFQSNYDKALYYSLKALKINEELGDKDGIASNLGNIGAIYSEQNNYSKAIEYFLKTLEIYEELNDKDGIATGLGNIGAIYYYQGNYDKAIEYFLKSLKIYEELNDEYGIAMNLGNLGNAYSDQKNYKKALDYYLQAQKLYEKLQNKDKDGQAINFNNIGSLYNDIKQYNKALSYLNKALKIAKEIGVLEIEKNTYDYLSESYIGLGNYKKALEYKDKFIELNDSIFNTEKAKSLAEMNTKYESEKKEKQIIEQQAELKTSKLKAEKEKAEKERQQTQRNLFIIAFGLMIVLAGFVFRSYSQKKKANALLAEQKQAISEANEELNQQNEEITAQRDEIEQQRDTVTKQKEQIEEIHYEISESINYATRLQGAILSDEKVLDKYVSEHFVLFKPKDKVSGDFYWWANVENHTVITAADSTGHGVPGAFMSMLGASFLREIVQKEYVTHTGVILRKLRKEIIKALKQTGEAGTQKDGMDMAIISIDHETNIVQFSGANNPLYIVSQSIKGFKPLMDYGALGLYEVKPNKMPIAIYEKMDAFITHEIQLQKGDQLYMFSDGYADQFGGPKGKKFKYKPFKKLLLENVDKSMAKQKEILNQAFENWKGNTEQIDDVVVVGIKI